MSKKKKDDLEQYKDITVADMNVEGMPWYTKRPKDSDLSFGTSSAPEETLTPKETRRLIANALVAALLIGGVFLLAIFLFLLFCVTIWF